MSLDGLRVDHAGLDTAAEDLGRAVASISERLDRLDGELAPLRTDWTGEAQQAYQALKARWDGAMREMRDLLHDTGHAVRQSNAEYQAADRRGAAAFDG